MGTVRDKWCRVLNLSRGRIFFPGLRRVVENYFDLADMLDDDELICLEDIRLKKLPSDILDVICGIIVDEKFELLYDQWKEDEDKREYIHNFSYEPLEEFRDTINELFRDEEWNTYSINEKKLVSELLHNRIIKKMQDQFRDVEN